ncbi:DUF4189 domain-containing protein [Lysobacter sp. Hz 25]|uniref:DUF4189 domain-containing protein n=1 Tax=Lysobacter sp. Hz 25 TaxID=3383698 RepID=UPI0038D444F9
MNIKFLIAGCVLLCSVAGNVAAEAGCPPGMVPYRGGTDPSACGPMPQGPAPITPSGPGWSSRWGAIASDEVNGIMGAVDSRESKRKAGKDALSECQARGGKKCKVTLSYTNQCVVTIQGNTGSTDAHAATIEYATQLGMESCRKRGDSDCNVYYKACSLPVQVR